MSLWVCLFHYTSQKVKMTSDNKEIRGEEVVRWDLADNQLKMNITKGHCREEENDRRLWASWFMSWVSSWCSFVGLILENSKTSFEENDHACSFYPVAWIKGFDSSCSQGLSYLSTSHIKIFFYRGCKRVFLKRNFVNSSVQAASVHCCPPLTSVNWKKIKKKKRYWQQ